MWATGPTAGPTHTTTHLREGFHNSNSSRLRFFARSHPADPFIARERSDVFPESFHFLVRLDGFFEIDGESVHGMFGKYRFIRMVCCIGDSIGS